MFSLPRGFHSSICARRGKVTLLKILVFSDSHRYTGGMIQAIEEQQPDLVVHLGDLQRDAEELALLYPKLSMVTVPGNCDGWTTDPLERQFMVCGKRVLLSHGHIWHVKQGYDAALRAARNAGAHLLLFGHTHRPCCFQEPDGLWVLNPGSARSTFGLVLPEGEALSCSLLDMP